VEPINKLTLLLPIFIGIFVMAFGVGFALTSQKSGIFPIGENAVYIQGEACIINAQASEKMKQDMQACIEIHERYNK
jgi:hypothetical protein